MAGLPGRWLLSVSLLGILASPLTVLAQAERPWVDPPSGDETRAPAPAPAPAQPAAPDPVPSPAQQASTPPTPTVKDAAQTQAASEAPAGKAKTDERVRQKSVAERKVRSPSRQARTAARSQKQVVRRREPGTQVTQAQPRSSLERRARITRYGSIREGVDAGLEVMRLRTIQLPDGRRIDVLTRPDQDIASELPDGY